MATRPPNRPAPRRAKKRVSILLDETEALHLTRVCEMALSYCEGNEDVEAVIERVRDMADRALFVG